MIVFTKYPPEPDDVEFSIGSVLSDFDRAKRLSHEERRLHGKYIGGFIFSNLEYPSRSGVIEAIENATRDYPECADADFLINTLTTNALDFVNIEYLEKNVEKN